MRRGRDPPPSRSLVLFAATRRSRRRGHWCSSPRLVVTTYAAINSAERDAVLLLFLYNTGARVQEAADLRRAHLDLGPQPLVRLHGKGDKWRTCPLWKLTA